MRHLPACCVALVLSLLLATPAGAVLLRNIRPGVICRSADALARLTLPDGASRSAGARASPADKAVARDGGCVEVPGGGMIVMAREVRRNTSVILFQDELSGQDTPQPYYAANIDFAPYSVPHSPFNDAMGRNCPGKLEAFLVSDSSDELDLLDNFISTLPPATRRQVERLAAGKCEAGWRCQYDAEDDALSRLRLETGWADFVCRLYDPS